MAYSGKGLRRVLYSLLILLAILHQDYFLWDDTTLVFGFIPIGLGYHLGFSIVAAILWGLVMTLAWPEHIDEFANRPAEPPTQ